MQLKNPSGKKEPIYLKVLAWYERTRNWTNNTDEDNSYIIWSNSDNTKVPTDYPQLREQHLRILVIEAPPFVIVHNSSAHHPVSESAKNFERIRYRFDPLTTKDPEVLIYGFVADFIRELEAHMHFTYTINVADPSTPYHSLVALLAEDNRQYDIILSNIAATSDRMLKVDFSTPFREDTFRIITRLKPYSSSLSLFSCFNPFTWDVWAAIFAVMIYSNIFFFFAPFDRTSALWSVAYLPNTSREAKGAGTMANDEIDQILNETKERTNVYDEQMSTLLKETIRDSVTIFNAKDMVPFRNHGLVIVIDGAQHAMSSFAGNGAHMAIMNGYQLAHQRVLAEDLNSAIKFYNDLSIPRSPATINMSHRSITIGHLQEI
ncbi:unnamed protein product [Rotaria sp. Silwood2]|nr:unnamed protein product [Rotaria sp. Silwood2]